MGKILTLNDEALINALKRGDAEAFEQVYREYYKMAVSFVLKNSGREEDVKDIFQEMLFILVKKLRQEEFQLTAKLGTFVYAILRNLWMQKLQKKRETVTPIETETIGDFSSEEVEVKQTYEKKHELMAKVFQELKEDCQKIINASFYKKLPHAEIADLLGYSASFVRVKLHRCMESFRTKVRQHPNFKTI